MTIDARNSVWTANSIIRIINVPPGIVSLKAEVKRCGYDGRLFFCPKMHVQGWMAHHSWWVPVKMDSRLRENDKGVCRPQEFKASGWVAHHSWWVPVKMDSRLSLGSARDRRGNDKGVCRPLESQFTPAEIRSRNCRIGAEIVEKLCKWLALQPVIYYNEKVYNVVGLWLMQGIAKLRNVAEVVRTSFVYLTLPHIAHSKGTTVAK